MKALRYLAPAICMAALSGCAHPVYDQAAVPSALSAQRLATDLCDARAREQLIKSMVEWMDCILRAEKQTADAIKLSKPELYANYAMRAQLLAWQFDQGNVGVDEFRARYRSMSSEYYGSVLSASAIEEERVEREREAVRQIGEGLKRAGDAYAGKTSPPLNSPGSTRDPGFR